MKKTTLDPVSSELIDSVRKFVSAWSAGLIARRRPSGPIYHYCDATALLNIFRTRSLWATGTRYLNDQSELTALLDRLPEMTRMHEATPSGRATRELSNVIRTWGSKIFANAIGAEIFVACLSQNGDVLSQWRAYADDGHGFAIGFDCTQLATLSSSEVGACELKRILYGGMEEQQLLDQLFLGFAERIQPYLDQLDSTGWTSDHGDQILREWLSVRMSECLGELTMECKHSSFAEEQEWRIYAAPSQMQFRVSGGRIVPFKQIDMSSATNPNLMPITRIVVGPKADWRATERVLMYIADQYGYGHSGLNLTRSSAPYR